MGRNHWRCLAPRALLLSCVLLACAGRQRAPQLPRLQPHQTAELFPARVEDRRGWAEDLHAAFEGNDLHPDLPSVCAVIAVVEQESGYDVDPPVPGLGKLVEARLDAYARKLGPLREPVLKELLSGKAPGQRQTFAARLKTVRTERELDVLFRELLEHHQARHPTLYAAASFASEVLNAKAFEELNPITTAGSMQVQVRYAEELAEKQGRRPDRVREDLYTRWGGLYYGTARLIGDGTSYDTPLLRFADYNAGVFASRNAAFQEQLTKLTGRKLALDGDLLAYDEEGDPVDADTQTLRALLAFRERYAPQLSEWRVRRDVRQEKSRDFEETETWRAVKQKYRELTGREPVYARMPQLELESPKLHKRRTTAWFAESVQRRYEACLKRAAG